MRRLTALAALASFAAGGCATRPAPPPLSADECAVVAAVLAADPLATWPEYRRILAFTAPSRLDPGMGRGEAVDLRRCAGLRERPGPGLSWFARRRAPPYSAVRSFGRPKVEGDTATVEYGFDGTGSVWEARRQPDGSWRVRVTDRIWLIVT